MRTKIAVNINQSVFSIAVCMYHFITGKSEWDDPSFMLGYPSLEDEFFGNLINKIIQQTNFCALIFLEQRINSLTQQYYVQRIRQNPE